jgi:NADH-quinone oxidoreductase subunit H
LILSVIAIVLALFTILVERKLLAFSQRRMGPTLLGRNGALQIVADLFKLLTKELFIIPRPTIVAVPVFLALTLMSQILFSLNFV